MISHGKLNTIIYNTDNALDMRVIFIILCYKLCQILLTFSSREQACNWISLDVNRINTYYKGANRKGERRVLMYLLVNTSYKNYMKINLENKRAIVTGGTGQLGRRIVLSLAECGADVAIHYHSNQVKAEELAAQVRSMGREAGIFQADITKEQSIYAMRDKIYEEFGKPDIIVNNAVIQYQWKSVLEQDVSDYYTQFESCVMHNVYMNKAFVPHMIEQKYGRIVVINTECAALADPYQSAYVAGKRGLDGVVRCLAKEIGPYNVTINQVAPGWTISDNDRAKSQEVQPEYDKTVPLGHRGTDQDIANMVCFLASDLAAFTTGAYIPVSGGKVMPAI